MRWKNKRRGRLQITLDPDELYCVRETMSKHNLQNDHGIFEKLWVPVCNRVKDSVAAKRLIIVKREDPK